jgi:hypothetical protein
LKPNQAKQQFKKLNLLEWKISFANVINKNANFLSWQQNLWLMLAKALAHLPITIAMAKTSTQGIQLKFVCLLFNFVALLSVGKNKALLEKNLSAAKVTKCPHALIIFSIVNNCHWL